MSDTPETRIYGFKEFTEGVDAEFLARRRFYDNNVIADTAWNGWRLDPNHLLLELFDSANHRTYEVDLERCVDSAHILDWLVQVSTKAWDEHDMAKVVDGLLRALDDILHLQTNVCPSEVHKVLSRQRLRELVSIFLDRFHAGEQP
ncbi:hypothetical protein ACIBCT_21000 [Streptosporangium sp. NPDC050855]|uniref:hypothetical protein n=1 Tax=Streptosporangium sp. NPDC050855 TaxID=3366194 RepID=UPI0037A1841E